MSKLNDVGGAVGLSTNNIKDMVPSPVSPLNMIQPISIEKV